MEELGFWGILLSGAVLGSAATIMTGAFGYFNVNRGQDIQLVNIALSILGGENKDSSVAGRKFALRALRKFAKVDIPDDEFEQWAKSGTLPENIFRAPPPGSSFKRGSIYGIGDTGFVELDPNPFRKAAAFAMSEQRDTGAPKDE